MKRLATVNRILSKKVNESHLKQAICRPVQKHLHSVITPSRSRKAQMEGAAFSKDKEQASTVT